MFLLFIDLFVSEMILVPYMGTFTCSFHLSFVQEPSTAPLDCLADSQNSSDWPSWNSSQTTSEFTLVVDGGIEVVFEEVRMLPEKSVNKRPRNNADAKMWGLLATAPGHFLTTRVSSFIISFVFVCASMIGLSACSPSSLRHNTVLSRYVESLFAFTRELYP